MRSGVKQAFSLGASVLAAWLGIRYLLPMALPFLLGAALAFAAEPGVRFLSGKGRLPRTAAVGIGVTAVFVVLGTLLVLLFSFLLRELGILAGILPTMERTVREGLNALQAWLLELSGRATPAIREVLQQNVTELFSSGADLLDRATHYALELAGNLLSHLPDSALGLGTAVLSAFLISSELPRIRQWLELHIPDGRFEAAGRFLLRLRSTAGLWLIAQLKLVGITYLMLAAGFLLLRVRYALLCALAVAAVDAFPILGTGTILVPWSLVCLLEGNSAKALGLVGLYITAAMTRSTLEPRLIGRQLGLDPLVTLIALYTGFHLWGFPGMIVMPLLAITAVRMIPETDETQ